jgi:porin
LPHGSKTAKSLLLTLSILCLPAVCLAQELVPVPDWNLTLTKDWGGSRQKLADHGLVVEMDATHVTQHVFDGGRERGAGGKRLDDTEHMFSVELDLKLDTDKANLWPGGLFRLRVETRAGKSVTNRAGSPVNYDALLPLVPGRLDDEVIAVNEFTLTQFLTEKFGVFAGLIDAAYGDANDFAGDGRSNDYFLNTNLNANPVGMATTPDVTLGAGAIFLLSERVQGWVGLYDTEGSAGYDPFDTDDGTTFFTEWSRTHRLGEKDGKQTLGLFYGIDMDRIDLFTNSRLGLESLVENRGIPTTDEDTWAVYYSAQQYIQGDADQGWGAFLRAGISDGDPNPVEYYAATGLGGKGLFDARPNDRFGIGAFWVDFADDSLLAEIDIDDSYGFEVFYTFEVKPWLKVTPDIQVIESPLPRVDDPTVVGAIRTQLEF